MIYNFLIKQIGLLLVSFILVTLVEASEKIVIAHRGASGYLPEHSLPSKAMAYAMGADYLEQDLVVTKDNRLVVLHDIYLDRITNVIEVFPNRKRNDGHYYVIDFTLREIRQLKVTEGFKSKNGKHLAVFPHRFPIWKSSFQIHTFEEEIELVQGLNKSMSKTVGIYPEIKSPSFHRHEGKDISKAVILVLKKYGYTSKSDLVYLQCFDPIELRRIHNHLLPENNMDLKLVQLVAQTRWRLTLIYQGKEVIPYNYSWMFKPDGMKKIAEYADGIGLSMSMIIKRESSKNKLKITDIVLNAHEMGMKVHPYTFRADQGRIPSYASDFEDLLRIFYYQVGVDGVFTDFPDRVARFLRKTEAH
jgi:glycerophosphoryl diester phosphodiesterase